MLNPQEMYLELTLTGILVAVLLVSRDLIKLLNSEKQNTLLFIPLATIFLPVMVKYPLSVLRALVILHLVLMGIVAASLGLSLLRIITPTKRLVRA